ncbi:MAG: type II toxin-antitoxin system VapC family toxin [Beijerinckiaceae bacterium]
MLDSSACLAWCFADERTPRVLAVLERVVASGAVVPSLWRYEVANALLMAEKRKRVDAGWRRAMLQQLRELEITVDTEADASVWHASSDLAAVHGLTVYDAAYLELALRRRLPLATLDAALSRAAGTCGVSTL